MQEANLPLGPTSSPLEQTRRFTYDIIEFMEECRELYGDCFTIRLSGMPPMVLVGDPGLASEVLSKPNYSVYEASAANKETMVGEALGRSFLMVLGGEEHKKLSPVLVRIQNDCAESVDLRKKIRELTIRRIESFPINQPFKLRYEMQALSLELMTHIALGDDPLVPRQLLIDAVHHMVDTTQFGGKATMLPNAPAFLAAREEVYKIYDQEIERRRREGRGDRLDMLSRLIDPDTKVGRSLGHLSTDWLRDQMLAMTVAGYDTTATTLSWTMFHVLRQKSVSADLMEECVSLFNSETLEAVLGDDSGDETLPILSATIEEAERLHPVTPLINRMTTKMTQLGEWLLPKGVMVCPCLHLLHRHEKWEAVTGGSDRNEFRPERMMALKKTGKMGEMPFYAWGGGNRRCPGRFFAAPEMKIIIATLLANSNLQLMRTEERTQRRAFALVPEKGAEVVYTGRKAVA